MDNFDIVNLNGYKYFGAIRKKCKRKPGGVGLLVNAKVSKFVRVKNSDSEHCLWFELSNELCSTKTVFGIV